MTNIAPENVLEIGCGLGAVGTRLARRHAYTATEPDKVSFAIARERLSPFGGSVINADHRAASGSEYDLVCAFEVLEHIEDDRAAVLEWLALVRPGGRLLISVPADPERFGASDVAVGHYRRYTAAQLRELLEAAGGSDVRVLHYGWPAGYILDAARNWLVRIRGHSPQSMDARTHASGRQMQPAAVWSGWVIRIAMAPFVAIQRRVPQRGPGLIAVTSRPSSGVGVSPPPANDR